MPLHCVNCDVNLLVILARVWQEHKSITRKHLYLSLPYEQMEFFLTSCMINADSYSIWMYYVQNVFCRKRPVTMKKNLFFCARFAQINALLSEAWPRWHQEALVEASTRMYCCICRRGQCTAWMWLHMHFKHGKVLPLVNTLASAKSNFL